VKVTPDQAARVNREAYRTPEALAQYSTTYNLRPEESYLIDKFFRSGAKILDLGCGGGRTTLILHERGFSVKGIDLSDVLIAFAQHRFPYLDLEVGDFTALNDPADSADHVLLSHNGIDYAPSREARLRAFAEVHRVLKPGGTFVFSSHNLLSLLGSPYYWRVPARIPWMFRNVLRGTRPDAYILDLGQWTYYGRRRTVEEQLRTCGFDVLEVMGVRMAHSAVFVDFISPWIYYVARKPAGEPRAREL